MSAAEHAIAGKLTTLAARLKNLGGKILFQTIRVAALPQNVRLLIDGIEQKPGTALPWPSGQVRIEIKGKKLCPIKQEVQLAEKQHLVLRPDLSKHSFPKIHFEVSTKNAVLKIDGKQAPVNQALTFTKCKGNIAYEISLPDGERKLGQIELSAGLNKTVSVQLLTKLERNRLRQIASAFETSKLLTGTYALSYPFSDKLQTPQTLHSFRVDYTEGLSALRYGGGISYGFGGQGDHLIEAYGQLTAQLIAIGKGPLNLTKALALIPFLSVDLGFGYHGLSTKESEDRGDFGDFLSSYILARGHVGLLFAPSEKVALKVTLSHDLTMERSFSFNAGIAVKLP